LRTLMDETLAEETVDFRTARGGLASPGREAGAQRRV